MAYLRLERRLLTGKVVTSEAVKKHKFETSAEHRNIKSSVKVWFHLAGEVRTMIQQQGAAGSILKSAGDEPTSDRCVANTGVWEPAPS